MMLRRGRRIPAMVPIASMGDIAFLLIIFFMLTSNFIKEAHVVLDRPTAPDIEEMKESQISVSMDKEGQVWLQGEPCPVEVIEEGVAALLADRDDKLVMLKIDREAPHEAYGEIFLQLSRAGAEIALVGLSENE